MKLWNVGYEYKGISGSGPFFDNVHVAADCFEVALNLVKLVPGDLQTDIKIVSINQVLRRFISQK